MDYEASLNQALDLLADGEDRKALGILQDGVKHVKAHLAGSDGDLERYYYWGRFLTAMEEYEQLEVINGLSGPLYGPANPSGLFNFVTKRPTEEQLGEIELGYESNTVANVHADLGGRVGKNRMFGYRSNLLLADGNGFGDGFEQS